MTDRVQSLTIQLDRDYRVDDVEAIVNAIRMVKGVQHVEHGPVVGMMDWSARMMIGSKYESEIWEAIQRVRDGKNSTSG